MNDIPETAFERGYHKMTSGEMGADIRKRIDSAYVVHEFSGIERGQTYLYRKRYGSDDVFRIENITPSGKQADVTKLSPNGDFKFRIHAASYREKFIDLESAGVLELLRIEHRDIIKKALWYGKSGITVAVAREYPDLFVEIPDRFDRKIPLETKVDRIKRALESHFGKTATAAEFLDRIESHHVSIRELQEESTRMTQFNPALKQDYETYIADNKDSIDFYRWLLPHVSAGGVFSIEK